MSTVIPIIMTLTVVVVIVLTIRVAYVTFNGEVRDKVLAKLKAKYGDSASNAYRKVYTRQNVVAMTLVCLWLMSFVISNLLEVVQERDSIMSTVIGGAGLILGIVGLYLSASILKKE